jgi:hypothetical protein
VCVCVGSGLCTTLSSSINTMIRSSPACSRKKIAKCYLVGHMDRFNTKLRERVASLLPSAHLCRLHASIQKLANERGMLNKHCLALASPRLAPKTQGCSILWGWAQLFGTCFPKVGPCRSDGCG